LAATSILAKASPGEMVGCPVKETGMAGRGIGAVIGGKAFEELFEEKEGTTAGTSHKAFRQIANWGGRSWQVATLVVPSFTSLVPPSRLWSSKIHPIEERLRMSHEIKYSIGYRAGCRMHFESHCLRQRVPWLHSGAAPPTSQSCYSFTLRST
jgi:hypothetical protein